MASKQERDVEKGYPKAVPARATFTIEHEKTRDEEEIEFQIKWQR